MVWSLGCGTLQPNVQAHTVQVASSERVLHAPLRAGCVPVVPCLEGGVVRRPYKRTVILMDMHKHMENRNPLSALKYGYATAQSTQWAVRGVGPGHPF